MTPRHLAAALTLLLATPATAQEVIGTVTGTLDGTERTWFLTRQDGMSQSDFSGLGGFQSVSIVAHATDSTVMSTKEALVVSFSLSGEGLTTPMSTEVRYLAEGGFSTAFTAADDAPATITLTEREMQDDALRIAGTVSGVLGWSGGIGQDPDMGNAVTLDATFEATLHPVN